MQQPLPQTKRRARRRSPTWPWNVVWPLVGGLLAVAAAVGYFIYTQSNAGRGYTGLGLALGITALSFIVVASAYSVRRRGLQERLPGTLRNWLWGHIVLGGLTLVLALLHGGFWPRLSFGWTALVLLFLVVASGMLGRLLYARVPELVNKRVGNLVVVDTQREIENLELLIDQQLAGRSAELKQRVAQLSAARAALPQWEQATQGLAPAEAQALHRTGELTLEQLGHRQRLQQQRTYQRLLKFWRGIHLPVTVALLLILPIHILVATGTFERTPSVENFTPPLRNALGSSAALPGFEATNDSRTCGSCHVKQYNEWLGSMHSYAQATTTTEWQTILYDREADDPAYNFPEEAQGRFCLRCHTPIGTRLEEQDKIPANRDNDTHQVLFDEWSTVGQQGVNCITCHLPSELPEDPTHNVGSFVDELLPSKEYWGTFGAGTAGDPALVGNPYHHGGPSPAYVGLAPLSIQYDSFHEAPEFCSRCHNVNYSPDGSNFFELQKTYTEWRLNALNAAEVAVLPGITCQDCHMSSTPGVPESPQRGPAAVGNFDRALPDRDLQTHFFTGVDHPRVTDPEVDGVPRNEAVLLEHREALIVNTVQPAHAGDELGLQVSAASETEAGQPYTFTVSVANLGAGHNFPTGFAFARQGWLDITVRDDQGGVLLRSGALDPNGDLVGTRCNNPTQQIVTADLDALVAGGDGAVAIASEKLGLEGLDEAALRAGGPEAVRLVLAAQQANNEAPVQVGVAGDGGSVTGDRKGFDGNGTAAVPPGAPCVVNIQTQLFTLLPDGSTLGGEEEAYVQTRVLGRFVQACQKLAAGVQEERERLERECEKGPAQAFGIIAGQRITLVFETLPVPAGAGTLTVEVAFRFRNYPPYFVRALARDTATAASEPGSAIRLAPDQVGAAAEAIVAELIANTVTIAEQQLSVDVR